MNEERALSNTKTNLVEVVDGEMSVTQYDFELDNVSYKTAKLMRNSKRGPQSKSYAEFHAQVVGKLLTISKGEV